MFYYIALIKSLNQSNTDIMEYKVVPFVASIDPRTGTSDQVAEQLENLINQGASGGWNYVRLESVTTYVHAENGCFNNKPGYTTARQMVVFSRP